jgi:thiosulfate/3-mercaptopyruvate sulfurtransferase
MPVTRLALAVSLVMLTPAAPAAAQEHILVTPAQLAARMTDEKLVLLHVGEKDVYDRAHLAGARFVDYRGGLHATGELTLQMLPPDVLRERLAALGISDDSRVVVYFADGWLTPATRVMLTLHYAGLPDVALLDGGMDAWKHAGHPVTADAPAPRTGSLSPLTLRPIVADADAVQAAAGKPGIAIVDARAPAFYDGTQTGGREGARHKTGHIAGALSVPFNTLSAENGVMKPVAELRAIFDAAGVKPGDTVIAYCHIGQQATGVVLAARLLGHDILLYDGSFEDWSRRNLPVEAAKR